MIGRRSLAALLLLGLGGPSARAQGQPDVVALREELMTLERQSWEYLKARNRAGMRHFLADDAVMILDDGTRYYKSEMLDYIPNYRLDSYEIDPQYGLRVISPTVAALIYRVTSRGAERFDRTETSKVLATSVYVQRDGKWQAVLYQETPSR